MAVARQCVVDFMNADLEGKYPIEWKTSEELSVCMINGDKELLRRAVNNVINNSQSHNPDGCHIAVEVQTESNECYIIVEDDGVGITDEKLEKLRNTPHYMMSDSSTSEPRHGLGLLIIQQIVRAHHGKVTFEHGENGGFCVKMSFPMRKE